MRESVGRFDVPGADGDAVPVSGWGHGPAVLVVHGGSSAPENWAAVAAALAPRHRVLAHHRFTYRRTPPPAGASAMAGEVADVLAVAGAVDGPVLLVGHSSGGVVALEAALAAPDRFAGMLLYEPPVAVDAPLGGDALRRARAAVDAGDHSRAMAIHLREIVRMSPAGVAAVRLLLPPLWRRLSAFAPAQVGDAEAVESLGVGLDRYAHLAVPALLLGGGRSPAHLRARLDALAGVLPGVDSTVILPRQGHLANTRAPGQVARVISGFADRVLR